MGGFMLCENGQPIQILIAHLEADEKTNIIWNIQKGIIDPPIISEEDIKDRSKGDAISKTFIILQTTWFVVQCIARWMQQLPVTELEIVTLAFAMLNGVTYAVWWNKPQNVGRPVFFERKKTRSFDGISCDLGTIIYSGVLDNQEYQSLLIDPHAEKKSWLRQKIDKEIERHPHSAILLLHIPYRVLQAVLRLLLKMFGNGTHGKLRVGMFSSLNLIRKDAQYAMAVIGTLFGTVHMIPSWFLDFSSRQEMWLWRVSAISITIEPILTGFLVYVMTFHGSNQVLTNITIVLTLIGVPCYIIARIILLTLSLTSLRSLPPAALQTIEWTTVIPHL